jgi:hypothetical protein
MPDMSVEILSSVKTRVRVPRTRRSARREAGGRIETRPRRILTEPSSGDDLPVLIYFDLDIEDPAAPEAIDEVEGALTGFLEAYGLDVGEREEISGSITIKLKAFQGLRAEAEIRLDLLTALSAEETVKKEIPPERKSAIDRLLAVIQKFSPLISLGSLIISLATAIHGWNPPKPVVAPPPPQYIFIMQKNDILYAEVDSEFADAVHSGRITVPQVKAVLSENVKGGPKSARKKGPKKTGLQGDR